MMRGCDTKLIQDTRKRRLDIIVANSVLAPTRNVIYKQNIDEAMKTYLIEDTGDSAIIGFKDANLTLITPIMKALYDDSNVEMVRYVDKHPELDDRTLYVKVKKGNALDAIKKASKAVAEYYSGL